MYFSAERLSNVHVEIGLQITNLTEIVYHNDVVNPDVTFEFDPSICARYVKVWIEKKEFLTICEIEVYGSACKYKLSWNSI